MKMYEQISNDIQTKIIEQNISRGCKLPSIIELCKEYNCSKGTIIKAYDILCEKHIIYSSPQRGFYVADNLVRDSETNSNIYDLTTGNPIVNNVPIKDIQHCLNSAVEIYSNASLEIGLVGIPSLIKILPDTLAKNDIYCESKNIYVCQGTLQVLTILSKMPFPNGNDTILIEDPSYMYYINFLKEENLKVKTIKRNENGIDLEKLEEIFQTEKIKFFFTIPRNHNPLGTYYTVEQRKSIIRLAHKYNVYIIEDDYFADVCNLPYYSPIYYYSNFKNCIYLKSYTKIIPYIRIGIVVIPDDLIKTYEKWIEYSYYLSYYIPSLVSQATFESYIKSSIYMKHITSIYNNMKQLLELFRKVTSKWDKDLVKIIGGHSGYYLTLVINKDIDCNDLLNNLANRNVLAISNIDSYYDLKNFDNSIRISISRIDIKSLKVALNIIYEEILNLALKKISD